MFADFKYFAIFATLVLVWISLVRGDDLKCYDSGKWNTLGSRKEVSCPNRFCTGIWTEEPGKDEKKGVLMCNPMNPYETRENFTALDLQEYRNKKQEISRNQETFFETLLNTTDKISASGSGSVIDFLPGISLNGKGTGYIKDHLVGHLFCKCPFSEKRKVKLEIDANIGAVEFQVKLDQEVQFDKDSRRGDIKINKKSFAAKIVCIGQPQVCTSGRSVDLEAFEKAALKEFGSNKEVTLTWGKEINFRITGNFKPIVEKYPKVKKAFRENPFPTSKNAIEKIIDDITLEAKGNVDIDDSTDIEFSFNGNSTEILNHVFRNKKTPYEQYAYKICTEKKCLHAGQCTKNLCNHPEDLVKMANSAEGIKLSIVFMALNLLFLTKL